MKIIVHYLSLHALVFISIKSFKSFLMKIYVTNLLKLLLYIYFLLKKNDHFHITYKMFIVFQELLNL
jgi:hypothetical protein